MEVPHAHLHLIPLNSENDLDLSNAHTESPEAMQTIQQAIIDKLQKNI
jgi:diadenosine tetraphosphate (Ap4A) HIT family hydrolase